MVLLSTGSRVLVDAVTFVSSEAATVRSQLSYSSDPSVIVPAECRTVRMRTAL
ncbi:hypothetical protein Mapa_004473 [Marchantia paleacea]|nr:hypothetical protein Mapa_004473 [Marchantia paleacea]